MVEPLNKKIQRPIRNSYYWLNYELFRALRLWRDPPTPPKHIKKILAIELAMIGDVLVCSPSFSLLKKAYPKAELHVLCFEKVRTILEGNEDVDHIIGVQEEPSLKKRAVFHTLLKTIKKEKYDMGILFHHGTLANSLLLYLAGIPIRVGSVHSGILKGKGFLLTHKTPPHDEHAHAVKQDAYILKTLGIQPKAFPAPKLRWKKNR